MAILKTNSIPGDGYKPVIGSLFMASIASGKTPVARSASNPAPAIFIYQKPQFKFLKTCKIVLNVIAYTALAIMVVGAPWWLQ